MLQEWRMCLCLGKDINLLTFATEFLDWGFESIKTAPSGHGNESLAALRQLQNEKDAVSEKQFALDRKKRKRNDDESTWISEIELLKKQRSQLEEDLKHNLAQTGSVFKPLKESQLETKRLDTEELKIGAEKKALAEKEKEALGGINEHTRKRFHHEPPESITGHQDGAITVSEPDEVKPQV